MHNVNASTATRTSLGIAPRGRRGVVVALSGACIDRREIDRWRSKIRFLDLEAFRFRTRLTFLGRREGYDILCAVGPLQRTSGVLGSPEDVVGFSHEESWRRGGGGSRREAERARLRVDIQGLQFG